MLDTNKDGRLTRDELTNIQALQSGRQFDTARDVVNRSEIIQRRQLTAETRELASFIAAITPALLPA